MVDTFRHSFVLVSSLLTFKFAGRRTLIERVPTSQDEKREKATVTHPPSSSTSPSGGKDERISDKEGDVGAAPQSSLVTIPTDQSHASVSRFKLCEGLVSSVPIGDNSTILSTSPQAIEMKRLWEECREVRLQQESKKRTDQKLVWRDNKGEVLDRSTATSDAPVTTVQRRSNTDMSELEKRADILTSTIVGASKDVKESAPSCPGWVKPASSGLSNSLPIVTFRQVGEDFVELKLANDGQRLYREWHSPELRKFAVSSDSGLLNKVTVPPIKHESLSAIDDKQSVVDQTVDAISASAPLLMPHRPASPGRSNDSINNYRRKAVIQCTKTPMSDEVEQTIISPTKGEPLPADKPLFGVMDKSRSSV